MKEINWQAINLIRGRRDRAEPKKALALISVYRNKMEISQWQGNRANRSYYYSEYFKISANFNIEIDLAIIAPLVRSQTLT